MEIFALIILGLVQGATEFLPVSSSGHLVLLGKLFNVPNSLFVSIVLHLATLLSIIVVLRKEIFSAIRHPFQESNFKLAVATIPTCVIALVLMPLVNEAFSGAFLPICFVITAIVLLSSDFIKRKSSQEITYKQALIMGIAQGLAVFPGISRSGSTISAGKLSGASSEKTAKFSFMMSIPIILLSFILEVYKLSRGGEVVSVNVLGLVLSFVTAFFVGVISIKAMIKLTEKAGFKWFALYLVVIAIVSNFI